MSKKCFWVSEELPSDGQRSEIWNYHGVTEIIEDVGVDLMRRFDSDNEELFCDELRKLIKKTNASIVLTGICPGTDIYNLIEECLSYM